MHIHIKRFIFEPTFTIGIMHIDGSYACYTLEDRTRHLDYKMPLAEIQEKKVPGYTAIPTGLYTLDLTTPSPRYSRTKFYQDICHGCVPRLLNVPAFNGILIHTGNTSEDTEGCILVGTEYDRLTGRLYNSKIAFKNLYLGYFQPWLNAHNSNLNAAMLPLGARSSTPASTVDPDPITIRISEI